MLGQTLKELRFRRGITQAEFARDLGVSQQAVGGWEVNRSEPSFDTLKRIAAYFNVSIDYLLGEDMLKTDNEAEDALLDGYRHLNSEGQRTLMMLLGSLRLSHGKQLAHI